LGDGQAVVQVLAPLVGEHLEGPLEGQAEVHAQTLVETWVTVLVVYLLYCEENV